MNPPIHIAVLGLGRAGWTIHVKRLRQRSDFKIVDVADPDPSDAKKVSANSDAGRTPIWKQCWP